MNHKSHIAGAVFLVALTAQGAVAPSIEGTATYRERIALPPTAVFEATLLDVSRADVPADVIARTHVPSPGYPPIRFAIRYDATRIRPRHTYVVRAHIVDGKRLMFTTDSSYPVLTHGHGNTVVMIMRMTRRS